MGWELFGKDYLLKCFSDGEKYYLSVFDILVIFIELIVVLINYSYRNFLLNLLD